MTSCVSRKYRRAQSISKIVLTLDNIVFIDTQVSKKASVLQRSFGPHGPDVDSCFLFFSLKKLNDESIMRSLLEIKTPVRSAARSYILTSPDSSNVGILEVEKNRDACALLLFSSLIGPAVSRATGFG